MGSRSTQILAAVAVVVGAAFAVAVGVILLGDDATASRADYQATVVNARDRVDFALVRITKSQSTDELVERIDEAAAVVGKTATDVEEAGVAEGFEEANDRLVTTMRSFSDELAGTAAQFRDPTFAGTLPAITSLSFPQWNALNAVLVDLKEQGLEVEPLPRH
jgi:crotonobetainyl-CoA:carnitine CoA-transferase CaiB-like acyl-CoA transferase